MTEDSESLASAAEELRQMIGQLNSTVTEANNVKDQLQDLTKKSKFNRNLITFVGAGLVLQLAVVVSLIVMGIQLNKVIETQRDSALCPLYEIFVQSDTPQNRERAKSQGQDMKERAKAFDIIRNSYQALHCEV